MRVKICGNTTLEDARAAVAAGADMLGFIFYEASPRSVTPEAAGEIIASIREETGRNGPLMVGVFVDEAPAKVQALIESLGLDLVQLHGSEPPVEVRMLGPYAFKAIRPQSRGDAEAMVATYSAALVHEREMPDFLVDTYHPWKLGGTGQTMSWAIPEVLARRFRILLAGGLRPANVQAAIEQVRPWGVDVASGVESTPGVKDHALIREFVRNARALPE